MCTKGGWGQKTSNFWVVLFEWPHIQKMTYFVTKRRPRDCIFLIKLLLLLKIILNDLGSIFVFFAENRFGQYFFAEYGIDGNFFATLGKLYGWLRVVSGGFG